MKTLLQFAGAALVLCLSAAPAAADDDVAAKMRALFQKADADGNEALSPSEQAKAVDYVKKNFGAPWALQIGSMFSRAERDGNVTREAWLAEVKLAAPSAKTEKIPMRDGVTLATDILLPPGAGPFPVVLARTPYSRVKRGKEGESFIREGYAFVIQDMRGRFDSGGENLPFIGCGWAQHQDGADTLEWLKKQPWCNGRIATIGGSAGGITQNMLAAAAPQGLLAQYISVAACSMYGDASYIGGAFREGDVQNWMRSNQFDPKALEITRARPAYDDYWAGYDTTKRFPVMQAPAVHVGGWFDMFQQATIDQFTGRQHHGGPGARGTQKLVMGPWSHGIGRMPVGALTFPDATRVPDKYSHARWFAHYLKGAENGMPQEKAVAYYVMGDPTTPGAPGNEWRFADEWPVPSTETPVYFTKGRTLSLTPPAESGDAALEYTFDPANPCPTCGGTNLTLESGPVDQRKIESRDDVLVFSSEPLDHPVEITGRLTAKIFLSSSAVDTDLSVRLCDVYPDGRSLLIAEGIQRLRFRHSREKAELLTPGKVEEVSVDCWSTSIIISKGHRVRVSITSSNYPRFDINPGTGKPDAEGGARVTQTNRVYCDAARPSRLLLPVVK